MIDKILDKYEFETFTKADGFDDAIIGVENQDMRLVYSISKCIEILCKDMSYEDALDHFGYNVMNTYIGEKTPIFIDDDF